MADRVIEELNENQCLELIAPGGIGRIAYTGRFGPAVLPVNYTLQDGAIVFRTADTARWTRTCGPGSRTPTTRWRSRSTTSTRLPGGAGASSSRDAHHVTGAEQDAARRSGVEAWAPGTGSCSSGSSRPGSPAAASAPPKDSQRRPGTVSAPRLGLPCRSVASGCTSGHVLLRRS